jgi:two-component system OmpR family sensor kinase/two-component system sensor histidine kinase BaeS
MRRIAVLFAILFVLAAIGAATLVSRLLMAPADVVPRALPTILLNWTPLLLMVAWFLGMFFIVMTRVGRPLSDVVSAANQIGGGNFSVRVSEAGPPFLRTLARAFNVMAGRLDSQEQQRRRLVEDVAHELRTPLSVLRGRVEGMIDGVYATNDGLKDVLDQTLTLERLVADLATLSSAEGGSLRLEKESTNVAAFVSEVVASLVPLSDTAKVTLTTDPFRSAPIVDLDRVRMREVLTNLIVNAIQHTPAGGRVVIGLTTLASGVVIQVIDSGRGIAPEDLAGIFERFRKGPDSRGSGLGLAIARELTRAHGGDIEATSEPGQGTTMTVRLPVSALR